MKVVHLSSYDIVGGAARAAYRIHHSLLNAGVDSSLCVNVKKSGDWTVEENVFRQNKFVKSLYSTVSRMLVKSLNTSNKIIHSPAITPSKWVDYINNSDADIVNLHWIADEMLTISDIGRIKKPLIWTLHDMWAFCGAEHYTFDNRWENGYVSGNRPDYESGFDLNRWTWKRKMDCWKKPIRIVAPSKWMLNCVSKSRLMANWPIHNISNPIDTEHWKPIGQNIAREILGLPKEVPLLLFGAMGGGKDPRKGFELLKKALLKLKHHHSTIQVVIFGQLRPRYEDDIEFQTHYTGHLNDDASLQLLYSAADVFILPSRQDNQPLTCMEALTSGTPVVAFDTSGPPSMIIHKSNGYLAKAFDTDDLAEGIRWTLQYEVSTRNLGKEARKFAVEHFDNKIVSKQYIEIYNKELNNNNSY